MTPVQKPGEFLKPLANQNGYVNVDINTLQHKKFDNVFALGDCADLPTSKTLSAVNTQIHVVKSNLRSRIRDVLPTKMYDGYTACPVFVGGGKLVLAEFGYENSVKPTFSQD